MSRGDAAAATSIFSGDESRRRRGRDVDIQWRQVARLRYCRNETRGPIESWPPGWNMFYGMCDQASTPYGAYYNMTWVDSVAGAITYTGDDPTNYTTSLVGNRTVEFIETATAPFFVAAAVRAPHAPQLPPPWYKDALPNVTIPRSGAYNASTEGKPAWMATNPPLTAKEGASYDAKYVRPSGILDARRWSLKETGRGDAAAGDVDFSWRQVAVTPRPGTRKFRGDESHASGTRTAGAASWRSTTSSRRSLKR